jgi:hypothetical protein
VEILRVDRLQPDLHERITQAVAYYWRARQQQSEKQIGQGRSDQGARSAVTGGYQMIGFSELITNLIVPSRDSQFGLQSLTSRSFLSLSKPPMHDAMSCSAESSLGKGITTRLLFCCRLVTAA